MALHRSPGTRSAPHPGAAARQHAALIVAHDGMFARNLADMLDSQGFSPLLSTTLVGAHEWIESESFALAIIDMYLPDGRGSELVRAYDQSERQFAAIMLTRQTSTRDRIEGLEAGAEDCLVKPVSPRELIIRVDNALVLHRARRELRRPRIVTLDFGPWHLYAGQQRMVNADGSECHLTGAECNILLALHQAGGEPLARENLMFRCVGAASTASPRAIDVIISRLRHKLRCSKHDPYIVTVPGVGYAWHID